MPKTKVDEKSPAPAPSGGSDHLADPLGRTPRSREPRKGGPREPGAMAFGREEELFNSGQYSSSKEKELIGHELTHTVQQGASGPQGTALPPERERERQP